MTKNFLNQTAIHLGNDIAITWSQILVGLVLIVIAWLVTYYFSRFLGNKLQSKTKLNKDNAAIIQRIIFFTLLITVIVTILSFLNIPLGAFAFISGAVAIGFGFGAKTIIENFLSGWVLMSERPIRMGDFVELDGNLGTIISIGNRSTMVRRNDGAQIIIPNSQILESRIINWTLVDSNIRTFVRVGVSYGSDPKQIKSLLSDCVEQSEFILSEPKELIVFEDFGDNALMFDVFFWVSISSIKELREIRSELRFAISEIFTKNNIVIAFPQRDVHLHLDKSFPSNTFQLGNNKHEH